MANEATTRERILEGCYACIARHGIARTTVEDVAREAGLSRATVYRVFPGGRDDLVRETVVWEMGRFFGRLAEAVAGADLLYTDVWVSMGKEAESAQRLRDLAGELAVPFCAVSPNSVLMRSLAGCAGLGAGIWKPSAWL